MVAHPRLHYKGTLFALCLICFSFSPKWDAFLMCWVESETILEVFLLLFLFVYSGLGYHTL